MCLCALVLKLLRYEKHDDDSFCTTISSSVCSLCVGVRLLFLNPKINKEEKSFTFCPHKKTALNKRELSCV